MPSPFRLYDRQPVVTERPYRDTPVGAHVLWPTATTSAGTYDTDRAERP